MFSVSKTKDKLFLLFTQSRVFDACVCVFVLPDDPTVQGLDKSRHLQTGEMIIIVVVLVMWAGIGLFDLFLKMKNNINSHRSRKVGTLLKTNICTSELHFILILKVLLLHLNSNSTVLSVQFTDGVVYQVKMVNTRVEKGNPGWTLDVWSL